MGCPVSARGLRQEGGEGSITGHVGEGRAPSGAIPSRERGLSFLASVISADMQWLGPGYVDRHNLSGGNVSLGMCLAKER